MSIPIRKHVAIRKNITTLHIIDNYTNSWHTWQFMFMHPFADSLNNNSRNNNSNDPVIQRIVVNLVINY